MSIFKRLRVVIGGIVVGVNLIFNLVPFVLKLRMRTWDSVFLGLFVTQLLLIGLLALELDKHEKQEAEKTKWPKLKFNEELLYIMASVAKQIPMNGHVKMRRDRLATSYMRTFPGKDIGDFNGLVSKLAARAYFDISHVHPDAYCEITDEGFAYYEKHRKRKRWKNKLTKIPPPPTGNDNVVAKVGSI